MDESISPPSRRCLNFTQVSSSQEEDVLFTVPDPHEAHSIMVTPRRISSRIASNGLIIEEEVFSTNEGSRRVILVPVSPIAAPPHRPGVQEPVRNYLNALLFSERYGLFW